jgi:hypothetical protein
VKALQKGEVSFVKPVLALEDFDPERFAPYGGSCKEWVDWTTTYFTCRPDRVLSIPEDCVRYSGVAGYRLYEIQPKPSAETLYVLYAEGYDQIGAERPYADTSEEERQSVRKPGAGWYSYMSESDRSCTLAQLNSSVTDITRDFVVEADYIGAIVRYKDKLISIALDIHTDKTVGLQVESLSEHREGETLCRIGEWK